MKTTDLKSFFPALTTILVAFTSFTSPVNAQLPGIESDYFGGGKLGEVFLEIPAEWSQAQSDETATQSDGRSSSDEVTQPVFLARSNRGESFVSVSAGDYRSGSSFRSNSLLGPILGVKSNGSTDRINHQAGEPTSPISLSGSVQPLLTMDKRPTLMISLNHRSVQQGSQPTVVTYYLYAGASQESVEEMRGILDSFRVKGVNVGELVRNQPTWQHYSSFYLNPGASGSPEYAGTANVSSSTTSSMSRPATPPTTDQVGMGELVQKHQSSLVLFEGKLGAGSGFVVKREGYDLVYTNIHVVAADQGLKIRTMAGAQVAVGAAEAAVDHDELRFRLAENMNRFATLELMENVNEGVRVGDEVAVLGNSEGAGVVRALGGRILGIGPDKLEIDAAFIPGNSGSPVIHVPTGKVIGIATYIMVHDTSFDDDQSRSSYSSSSRSRERKFRRFAYRMDSVKEWQPVNWPVFYKQAGELRRSEELTENVYRLMYDITRERRVDVGSHSDPLLRSSVSEFSRLASSTERISESDTKAAVGRLFASLRSVCNQELGPAQPRGYYDFFVDGFEEQRSARKDLVDGFDRALSRLGR